MAEGGAERRDSGRAPLELPVRYDQLNAFLADYTHNISRGGTFIRTDKPLEIGAQLAFRIEAPELGEPILLRGAVRWVIPADQASEEKPAGMGIAFLYNSSGERAEIEGRLDRLMVRTLGEVAFEKLMGKPAPKAD